MRLQIYVPIFYSIIGRFTEALKIKQSFDSDKR